MGFAEAELTCDGFLGGRVTIRQPRRGYRAGIDPVLLAAAVPAQAGARVLELGCGGGVASLCLGARVPGLALCGVERQAAYADLARLNAAAAGIAMEVVTADLARLPEALRARQFDHVLANPPYEARAGASVAADSGRATGRTEATPLAIWLQVGMRRLAPKGVLTLIQRAERLPHVLAALDDRAGSIAVWPLAARAGREAKLVLVRAVKGGRAGFRLAAPAILHAGAAHGRDGEDYHPDIAAVLRDGAPLPWLDA